MNEETKAIVASNLTLAYYQVPVFKGASATAPRLVGVHEDPVQVILPEVLGVYRAVLSALDDSDSSPGDKIAESGT